MQKMTGACKRRACAVPMGPELGEGFLEKKRGDMMTEHLQAAKQRDFLDKLENEYQDGRSPLASKATGTCPDDHWHMTSL